MCYTDPDELTETTDKMLKNKLGFQAESMYQYIDNDLNKRIIGEMTKEAMHMPILGNNSSNQKTELEENHIEEISARKSNFKITEKIEMSQENSTNKSSSNSNIKNLNQFNAQESLKFEGFFRTENEIISLIICTFTEFMTEL